MQKGKKMERRSREGLALPGSRKSGPVSQARAALIAIIVAAGLSACATRSGADVACAGADVVCTADGAVRGAAEGDTIAFKGIPYAEPPVGSLRWRAPRPAKPWQGVRDGSRFGPVCPQWDGKAVIGEEDCLTLNVWRPKQPADKPLPVMVFLTGGGNHAFSGQGSPGFGGVNYNGQMLAPQGVVYVSFNNRLGALGFLAHPALDAESADRVSGNYGSLDQIAMLRWLRRNIAAFGGDPQRIMLFGTSAGGGNVCALMTAPAARGLFHAAAMESSVPTGCELQTLADAENGTGRLLAQKLGCADSVNATDAACLRGRSPQDIVQAMPGSFGVQPRQHGPNMDGHVFPQQPIAAIRKGEQAAMPVIIGNATEETMQWATGLGTPKDEAGYEAALAKAFGMAEAGRVRAEYPMAAYASPHMALVRATTDAYFSCQSRRVAAALTQSQRQPVYRYLFDHALQNDPDLKAQGAIHTVEHAFFFPWQGSYRPTAADLAVQQRMVAAWTGLAKAGMPGPGWPADAAGARSYLYIGDAIAPRHDDPAHCAFWDTVRLPWPHM
jgi:para-nitrobenzyl esterase